MDPIKVASALRLDAPIQADPLLQALREFLEGIRPLSGQALMDLLTLDPDLNALFLLSAGVGEGYSIGEHTRMVVDCFEKELMDRPETQEILSDAGITAPQFMFFLALHDIGKGCAVQEHPEADNDRKTLELQYSRDVISAYCQKVKLENCAPLFLALLQDDAIGDICKSSDPSTSEILKASLEIRGSAEQCGRFIEEFLPLKELFHLIDAASYGYVRENFFITDKELVTSLNGKELPRLIGHTGKNRHKLARLSHCLRCSELPLAPPRLPFARDPETLQAIFSRSAFDFSWEEILDLDAWQKEIKQLEGGKSPFYCEFKKKLRAIKIDRLPFRTYLQWKSPYISLPKPRRKVKRSELIDLASYPHIKQNLDQLSPIQFLHGSNSAALMMMMLSGNPSLRNTHALLGSGIAPMCGELNRGITTNGINIGCLSVETIRNVPHVLRFALGTETIKPFDPVKFQVYLDPFSGLDTCDSFEWTQLVIALMHWKPENPAAGAKHPLFASPATPRLIEKLGLHLDKLKNETTEIITNYYQDLREKKISLVPPFDDDLIGTFSKSPIPEMVGHKIRRRKILERRECIAFLDTFHKGLTQGIVSQVDTSNEFKVNSSEASECIRYVMNPYTDSVEELEWNKHAVQLLQFKQWDPSGYETWNKTFGDLFLAAVDSEWEEQRKPLEQLLAIMDAEFTDEEKAVIQDVLNGKAVENAPLSGELVWILDSLSDISPVSQSVGTLQEAMNATSIVYRNRSGFMEGKYTWTFLISALLMEKTKIDGHIENDWKEEISVQLTKMQENRARLAKILNSPRSVVQIPQDEKTRALFTHPLPLIFASTCVPAERGPGEYIMSHPVSLGEGGVDRIYTDAKKSKRIIKTLLPKKLREQIKIGLFEQLDGGDLSLHDKSEQI